jgi:hypothetical protein
MISLQGCALMDKLSTKIADKLTSRMNTEVQKKLAQGLDGLTNGILNHDDPGTVIAGLPSYLIMLEGLLEAKPKDATLLMSAARLYSAYAGALVNEPERAKRLTARARKYAGKALCKRLPRICKLEDKPYDQFKPAVQQASRSTIEPLYVYGVAWAGWLQARTDDYGAIAELPKIESIFVRVTALKEGYDKGRAQLYLAVMRSQIPPSLGGKPETAKDHFEKALKHSDGNDLMIKVKYARHYARLVFNQELHDRLLKEVLEADPQTPKLTLSNVMAQDEAKKLKADDYF